MKQVFKTTILLGLMTGLFLAVGYMLGGSGGALIALILAGVMNFSMYWFSHKLVLKMQGAKPLDESKNPEIVSVVRQLADADGLPMPKLYYVDTPIPNAFATGRNPKNAVVAVTTGIVQLLDRNELRGVLAHELGHVKNRDMLVSTVAATIGGAISYLAQLAFWTGSIFGGGEDSNPIGAITMFILAPFAAVMIQMAVSRSREYLADQHGANLVGNGRDLVSALSKLDGFKKSVGPIKPSPNQEATAHLMFANMFAMKGLAGLFSTHPSTKDRIARLQHLH